MNCLYVHNINKCNIYHQILHLISHHLSNKHFFLFNLPSNRIENNDDDIGGTSLSALCLIWIVIVILFCVHLFVVF